MSASHPTAVRQRLPGLLTVFLIGCVAISAHAADDTPHSAPVLRTDQHYFSLSNLSALGFSGDAAPPAVHAQPTTTAAPTQASAFHIGHLAGALAAKLKALRNTELAVGAIQRLFDAAPATHQTHPAANDNDSSTVRTFAERLQLKLLQAQRRIDSAAGAIERLDRHRLTDSVVVPCQATAWPVALLDQHYDRSQIEIRHYDSGITTNSSQPAIEAALQAAAAATSAAGPAVRQAYFLSSLPAFAPGAESPCGIDRTGDANARHLRSLQLAAIAQKNIMLVIDHGGSLNADQLQLTRTFAIRLVQLLNARDRLAVVAVAGAQSGYYRTAASPAARFHAAHRDNRERFARYIGRLNGTAGGNRLVATNHSYAFASAFAVLRGIYERTDAGDAVPLQLVYVSRGLLSPVTEAGRVLRAIEAGQRQLGAPPVTIHTCAVVVDAKRIMYEKQFLKDVARQNYSKYGIDAADWLTSATSRRSVAAGRMLVVQQRDSAADMYRTVVQLFAHLLRPDGGQLNGGGAGGGWTTALPRLVPYDSAAPGGESTDIVVPLMRPLNGSAGSVGVDLYLSDIGEDVAAFNRERGAYAFIVTRDGVAVVHPSIDGGAAVGADRPPFYTDIGHLEAGHATTVAALGRWRQRLLVEPSGAAKVSIEHEHRSVRYTWQRAGELFIVCLVVRSPGPFTWRPAHHVSGAAASSSAAGVTSPDALMPDLIFHRTDLLAPGGAAMCQHFQRATSLSAATLFLSAGAYKRPFVHLLGHRQQSADERTHNARSVMAYLKDRSTLLANPGLLDDVRAEVLTVLAAMQLLRARHQAGDGRQDDKYIVRRYMATVATGVLQMFPGCVLGYDFEPRRRPWFVRAMAHAGRLVLTEPYLDAGGAGYIVTIAHTLHRTAHTNRPAAVVAVDVTLGFLYKLLLAAESECGRAPANIKCFLMDDAGFVLAHPNVLEPAAAAVPMTRSMHHHRRRRPLEHVTHVESYMANDVLNWRQLVEKRLCADFGNRTRQRYYRFNTSLAEVLTNRVHGERTKYQLTAVAGTNVFVAWLNASGDGGAAFCPCSTLDRICLNCNRMEPTNCECPCECPLSVNEDDAGREDDDAADPDADTDARAVHELCAVPSVHVTAGALDALSATVADLDGELLACSDINCEQYGAQLDCLGVQGCEWCQVDVDAESFFAQPFCTQQTACYDGVLGAETPYGGGYGGSDLGGTAMADAIAPGGYSVVVPVIGAMVALCAVIGVAMFCYRQTVDGNAEALYNSAQETAPFGVPLARFDFDDSSRPDDGGGGNGGSAGGMDRNGDLGGSAAAMQAAAGKQVAMISPYRIAAGTYRVPTAHAESDHGYSTMTPREDSEHQCFALAEPLLRGVGGNGGGTGGRPGGCGGRASSMSDSGSIGTSVSSPTNQQHHCFGGGSPRLEGPPTMATTSLMTRDFDASATQLGGGRSPHHVQAKVTVHRPMEMI